MEWYNMVGGQTKSVAIRMNWSAMSISFSKVKNVSLKDQAVRELENKILSGELKPGDRLPPERELASAMGISRSLVNLCVLELESKGFVKIIPRQGTVISDFSKHGTPQMLLSLMNYQSEKMDWTLFESMMDTRMLIESECTRLAVKNATDADFKSMEDAYFSMEKHESMDSFIEGNFHFHHALTSASGNAVYAMIFNSFRHALLFFLKLYFTSSERRNISLQQHRQLLGALKQKNEAAALDAIKSTLDMGVAGLAEVFKQ